MTKVITNRAYWLIPTTLWTIIALSALEWTLNLTESHDREQLLSAARYLSNLATALEPQSLKVSGSPGGVTPDTESGTRRHTEQSGSDNSHTQALRRFLSQQASGTVFDYRLNSLTITSPHPAVQPALPSRTDNNAQPSRHDGIPNTEHFTYQQTTDGLAIHYSYPLSARKSCYACHTLPTSAMNNIVGSLNFTLSPTVASPSTEIENTKAVYVTVWGLLLLLLLAALSTLREQLLKKEHLSSQHHHMEEKRKSHMTQELLVREEAQEMMELLLNSSGEGILVVDHHCRITFANTTATKMLRYEKVSQLNGAEIGSLLHTDAGTLCNGTSDHRNCTQCPIKMALSLSTSTHCGDYTFNLRDGSTLPAAISISPVVMDGYTLGTILVFSDITERKEHELELRKLSLAVEQSPASTLITNAHGIIEYVNKQFTYSSGYEAFEAIGKKSNLMRSGNTPDTVYQSLWDNLKGGKNWRGEILNKRKDGSLFWENISISPISDTNGKVTHYVALKEDISSRKQHDEEVWRLANYDSLTALINRHNFMQKLHDLIADAKRYDLSFTLLFIDLDGFKQVNDSLGHTAGDLLLKMAADRMGRCVRQSDILARLGGDEFTVITPRLSEREVVEQFATKLIDTLNRPFEINGQEVYISASIGIASYPYQATNSDELLNLADSAMYKAKASGKNTYHWHNTLIPNFAVT